MYNPQAKFTKIRREIMRKMRTINSKKIPKKLQKSLSDVICRIKSQTPNLRIGSTTSRLLSGCRHPKSEPLYASGHNFRGRRSGQFERSDSEKAASESAVIDDRNEKTAATLEDIDRFLFENFRSLYLGKDKSCSEEDDEDSETETETPPSYDSSQRSFETPDVTPRAVRDSRRFFISSGSSGSLIDDGGFMSSTITATSAAKTAFPKADLASGSETKGKKSLPSEDCIAVLKASANPYDDFRRSMVDVMEARARHGENVDWSFMEELLFCFLRLNEKKHYKFVLDAFVDSVVDMRQNNGDGAGSSGGGSTEKEMMQGKKGKERQEDIDGLV